VLNIDQNLLSVVLACGKGLQGYIKDTKDKDVFVVKMRSKRYALYLIEEEKIAFSSTTTNVDL